MLPELDVGALWSLTLGQITDPSKRLYWGFILSSLLLIGLYWWLSPQPLSWQRVRTTLFSRRYWLTRSSAVDVSLLSLNSLIKVSILIPILGSHLLGAVWVAGVLQGQFDSPDLDWVPLWGIAVAFTLCFFLLEDLSRYGLHRLMHEVPFLWRLHRVHHSATTLTPLTLHRIHPVEMTFYLLRGWLVFSLVSGVFLYLAGKQLTAVHILGVDALGFLFNALGANLRHSHIPISFGPFERWFISPIQHQIHHSLAPEHHNRNYGTCLAIWDKLGSSWVSGVTTNRSGVRLRFGVSDDAVPVSPARPGTRSEARSDASQHARAL